jgi:signal peptidase I
MNKKLNIKPIVILIIIIGFLILLKTQFPLYRISNADMEPNFSSGEIVLVNKLATLNSNDVCIFSIKEEAHIFRIVAFAGQKVEIKDGILYVDDVCKNETNTQLAYKVILGDHPSITENELLMKLKLLNDYQEYIAHLSSSEYQELKKLDFVKKISKIIYPKGYHYSFSDYPIFPHNKTFNWSIDNFGPLKIPKGSYFVLGDNRHKSIDSRYFGFVKNKDVIGKVEFKISLIN